jgi:hypothetical protein
MRRSWLYFATRSVREAEPVLIWPALVATAMSAMVTSSVSPERCEMTSCICSSGELDGIEGLGEGADLVHLHEDRVGGAGLDALLEELDVGDEEIVADELDLVADGVGELLPGGPVVFGAAVFDGDDRVFGAESL